MLKKLILVFFVFITISTFCQENQDLFIENIIKKMSLEEKISMIGGYEGFYIKGFPKLGVPKIKMSDGPAGVRNYSKSTTYPAPINLAASWDTAIANSVGRAIGMEAKSKHLNIMLGP